MDRAQVYDRLQKYAEAISDLTRATALSSLSQMPLVRARFATSQLRSSLVDGPLTVMAELTNDEIYKAEESDAVRWYDTSGLMALYENGVLMSQTTTAIRPFGALDPTQQPGVGIGNANSTYNARFNGLIDDLKLYDNALTAAGVLTDFNAGKGSLQSSTTISISDETVTEGLPHFNSSLGNLVTQSTNGGLIRSTAMAYGPDQNLYVSSSISGEILRYSPTGALLGAFVRSGSGGLATPAVDSLVFRPDGWLYVASQTNASVLRFNAVTGAFHDVFIASGSGGLSQANGMTFGPDGNIYISSNGTNQVLRYSGSSGAYLGAFVAAGSGGLSGPRSLVFGPDGSLYISSASNQSVLRYNGSTGSFIDSFIPSNRGGLNQPGDLLFNNGSLYVASQGTNQVLRYDAATGLFLDAVDPANSGGLDRPIGLLLGSDGSLLVGGYGAINLYGATTDAVFSVSLSSPWPTTVSINYATANGSAQAGSDFLGTSGTLTFLPGQMTQTIVVSTLDDSLTEGDETFQVLLSSPVGATLLDGLGAGTIVDNEFQLPTTKFFVVDDGNLDRTYEYSSSGASVENYTIQSTNTAPRGVASNAAGDKVWVVDANKKVYVYNNSGGLLGSWTAGSLPNNAAVEGITTNGIDVWIVDNRSDAVYKYAGAASRTSGSQNATSNFKLKNFGLFGNTNAKDIVTDETSIWTVNDDTTFDAVYKYTVSGTYLGDWAIDAGNSSPTGLTIDPTGASQSIWIVDKGADRVYEYSNARTLTANNQPASRTFALAAGNTNPQGIADPPPPSSSSIGKTPDLQSPSVGSVPMPWFSGAVSNVAPVTLQQVQSKVRATDDFMSGPRLSPERTLPSLSVGRMTTIVADKSIHLSESIEAEIKDDNSEDLIGLVANDLWN